jgi:hypothetical protein
MSFILLLGLVCKLRKITELLTGAELLEQIHLQIGNFLENRIEMISVGEIENIREGRLLR